MMPDVPTRAPVRRPRIHRRTRDTASIDAPLASEAPRVNVSEHLSDQGIPEPVHADVSTNRQRRFRNADRRPPPVQNGRERPARFRQERRHPLSDPRPCCPVVSTENDLVSTSVGQRRRFQSDGDLLERLSRSLSSGSHECMICMSSVGRSAAVWSCRSQRGEGCYAVLHLTCTMQWIRRSTTQSSNVSWRCPGCQLIHNSSCLPISHCFCGKMQQPPPRVGILPHSCGEICGRPRSNGCMHPCPLPCHPGPCPPCAVWSPQSCICGRGSRRARCGEGGGWVCERTCGKLLACGMHACRQGCHPDGSCGENGDGLCRIEKGLGSCPCGAEERVLYCGTNLDDILVPCETGICGKAFECGVHKCEKQCHMGSCVEGPVNGACPYSPEIWGDRCRCGNLFDSGYRKSCTDPLPECTRVCNRYKASCGHYCKKVCCSLDCSTSICEELVSVLCECGRSRRNEFCGSRTCWRCEIPCKSRKSCGRHKCDRKCCFRVNDWDDPHLCVLPCGRALACGKHSCDSPCHLGKCRPCGVVFRERLYCACGTESISGPNACGTLPPICRKICGKVKSCGHTCPWICHSGDCGKCVELTTKWCAGNHRLLQNVACSTGLVEREISADGFPHSSLSCGSRCGKQLDACSHLCRSLCHIGPCSEICNQPCTAPRSGCGHPCGVSCHGLSECRSDLVCQVRTKILCACGLRVEERLCQGAIGDEFVLPCDDKCEGAQRLLRMRLALAGDESLSKDLGATRYSGSMVALAQKWLPYLRLVEPILKGVVNGRIGSATYLPPACASRRHLVQEYASLYYRLDCWTTGEQQGVRYPAGGGKRVPRLPCPLLLEVAELGGTEAARYVLEFALDSPRIHLFDVPRQGVGEQVYVVLSDWLGEFRTRRVGGIGGEAGFWVDFSDANRALSAFRKLQACETFSHLKQCRLLNVPFVSNKNDQ